MSFRDMVRADIKGVFLNAGEFAEHRTCIYDGERYENIPVTVTNVKERDRRVLVSDHVQGLYLASCVVHLDAADIGGQLPEKGSRWRMAREEYGTFYQEFRIGASGMEMGMVRLELEAVDE